MCVAIVDSMLILDLGFNVYVSHLIELLCQDVEFAPLDDFLPSPAVHGGLPSPQPPGSRPCQATGARTGASDANCLHDANREEVPKRRLPVPAAEQDPDAAEECEGGRLYAVLPVRARQGCQSVFNDQ